MSGLIGLAIVLLVVGLMSRDIYRRRRSYERLFKAAEVDPKFRAWLQEKDAALCERMQDDPKLRRALSRPF